MSAKMIAAAMRVPAAALLLGGIVVVLLALDPLGISSEGVHALGPADEIARQQLREISGTSCSEEALISLDIPGPYFDQADKIAGSDQWLPGTSQTIWVGELKALVSDMGGRLIAEEGETAWVMVEEAAGPLAARLQAFETDRGRTIWMITGQERALPDAVCESY